MGCEGVGPGGEAPTQSQVRDGASGFGTDGLKHFPHRTLRSEKNPRCAPLWAPFQFCEAFLVTAVLGGIWTLDFGMNLGSNVKLATFDPWKCGHLVSLSKPRGDFSEISAVEPSARPELGVQGALSERQPLWYCFAWYLMRSSQPCVAHGSLGVIVPMEKRRLG